MNFDPKALEALAGALFKAGAPVLAKVIGGAVGGPFGVVAATIITSLAESFGADPSDPGALADAINAAPDAAGKVATVAENHADALADALAASMAAQNMKEAESASLFVAGWRPAFGWLCVIACAWQILASVLGRVSMISPDVMNPIWGVFTLMIGARTVEKWKGVARDAMTVLPKLARR